MKQTSVVCFLMVVLMIFNEFGFGEGNIKIEPDEYGKFERFPLTFRLFISSKCTWLHTYSFADYSANEERDDAYWSDADAEKHDYFYKHRKNEFVRFG